MRDNDFIFGQFIWTGIDYLGESGLWPSRGSSSGMLDMAGNIKPRGRLRAAMWLDEPVCYIGTSPKQAPRPDGRPVTENSGAWDTWDYEEGQVIRVVCYTNAAKARLLLDGKEVGAMTPYNDATGIIGWDVPYKAGVLKSEGYDASGKKVSEYEIRPSLRPAALKATAYQAEMKAGGLAQISVEVLDDNGRLVPLGDNEITCTVEGPGQLLGLESSNTTDTGNWNDNVQRAFRGRLLAYVRTAGDPGRIRVRFTSPYIKGAEVEITTR